MNFEDAFANLNEEQKTAVTHIDGPLMVLAGPGTGKTQILALRVAQILRETQLNPYNILCLTFTESGVVAMRRRLLEFIGTAAYEVRIHTFHSFCNDIIRQNPEKFLFARELEPLTDIERIELFRTLLDELPDGAPLKPFAAPYLYERDLQNALRDLKREDISPDRLEALLDNTEHTLATHQEAIESLVQTHGNSLTAQQLLSMQNQLQGTFLSSLFLDLDADDKKNRTETKNLLKKAYEDALKQLPKQRSLVALYRRYHSELKRRGRYDYEDMILMVVEKLKSDPELMASLREQFQYILVDEFQDSNGAQNEIVQLLCGDDPRPNVFVVGDDKQSIYRFQGASLENMLDFYQRYKNNLELITLQKNYRSQQTILDAATSLIAHSKQGLTQLLPSLAQHLTTQAPHPSVPLRIATCLTPQDEHHFLAEEIQALIAAGTNPSEIAVFYRNNRDSEALADLFLRLKIPFHLYSGKNILDDANIKKLLRLIKWLVHPTDDHELFLLLNMDFLNLPTLEVLELTHAAARAHQTLWNQLEQGSEPVKRFREKAAHWLRLTASKTFTESFEILVRESGYWDVILAAEDRLEQLSRLNTFFDHIKAWNKQNPSLHWAEFLEYIKLLSENHLPLAEAELSTQKSAVALMTAHRSKGLEFEHVFITGCTDKHWGNLQNREKLRLPAGLLKTVDLRLLDEKNEDERRLFYVALTRGKKQVTLTYAQENENHREQMRSVFLAELDPAFTQLLTTDLTPEQAENRLKANFIPLIKEPSAAEQNFAQSLLQNYTLSITHLNNYLRCPRRFYYENLLRAPRAKTKYEAFGTAVHRALQSLPQNKEALLSTFESTLKREILTPKDLEKTLEFGRQTLSDYFDETGPLNPKIVLTEYDFAPHGVHIGEVPITGKLDKIEILDPAAKTVNVVDYKTGNPDAKTSDLAPDGSYRRQIIFYQLLCDLSPQFPYHMVSGEIDFIQKSPKSGFVRRRFEVTPEEKETLKQTILSVYEDILSLRFLTLTDFETCGECEWCQLNQNTMLPT